MLILWLFDKFKFGFNNIIKNDIKKIELCQNLENKLKHVTKSMKKKLVSEE